MSHHYLSRPAYLKQSECHTQCTICFPLKKQNKTKTNQRSTFPLSFPLQSIFPSNLLFVCVCVCVSIQHPLITSGAFVTMETGLAKSSPIPRAAAISPKWAGFMALMDISVALLVWQKQYSPLPKNRNREVRSGFPAHAASIIPSFPPSFSLSYSLAITGRYHWLYNDMQYYSFSCSLSIEHWNKCKNSIYLHPLMNHTCVICVSRLVNRLHCIVMVEYSPQPWSLLHPHAGGLISCLMGLNVIKYERKKN